MRALWKKFASSIDERNTRERILILAASIVVVYVLIDSLLVTPVATQRKRLLLATQNDQAEIVKMLAQVQTLVRNKGADPDAVMKARLSELAAKQAELQRQIDAQSADMVPPEKMAAVLEKILANNPKLQLLEVKTLPRASITLEKETGPVQGQPAKTPVENKPLEIYRHGVQITMRGSYLDLLAYLKAIESLPLRMFWDRLDMSVTAYPTVTMKLDVYTISLEKVWLTV